MDIMLDLESLGTRPDCAILTLGAVKFDPFTPDAFGDSLYLRIDVDEQLALGREIQEDTLAWSSSGLRSRVVEAESQKLLTKK